MATPKIGFTRWYDTIPELAQAVRSLERTDKHTCVTICHFVIDMHENGLGSHHQYGVKKLGPQKVLGLMKSKSKRRWYDQNPVIHKAFNVLYLMDDATRYEAAIRIIVSLEAMKELEYRQDDVFSQAEEMTPERFIQKQRKLVQNIFYQPTSRLMDKVTFIRPGDSKRKSDTEAPKPKMVVSLEPEYRAEDQKIALQQLKADHITDGEEGMKLGGLNTQLPYHFL